MRSLSLTFRNIAGLEPSRVGSSQNGGTSIFIESRHVVMVYRANNEAAFRARCGAYPAVFLQTGATKIRVCMLVRILKEIVAVSPQYRDIAVVFLFKVRRGFAGEVQHDVRPGEAFVEEGPDMGGPQCFLQIF